MNVCIIGTGYVGLTTGACLALLGHCVTCLDSDEQKVAAMERGEAPFYEPHLEDVLAEARTNLKFTTDYSAAIPGAQVIFIAVGTPPGINGSPDLKYLEAAARGIGENLSDQFTVVVNKSTVPIGSARLVGAWIEEACQRAGRGRRHFAVASNPEFLREGSALKDSLYPDRVVIGADQPETKEVLERLYRPILDQTFTAPTFLPRPENLGAVPCVHADLASAELIKYAANAFLALKISYINEIGRLAERVGADIKKVARGMGLDERIGTRFLQAGVGWGGSCFGKDTAALVATASEYGLSMDIVKAAREVNAAQRERVVEKLQQELKILKGRTIGLLGLAFKPDTDDLREAPALDIARRLLERGARIKAHDPVAMDRFRREQAGLDVTCCESPEEVARDADALVLVTEWKEYRDLDWDPLAKSMRTRLMLDGRHVLDPARLERAGFRYIALA